MGPGCLSVRDPLLTPVLSEVLSSLVPLRYKGSASVSQMDRQPGPHTTAPSHLKKRLEKL